MIWSTNKLKSTVWQQGRPVIKDLAASRHRLCIDTSLCRTVALAELANAIPRSSYLFGVSWPDVRRTLLVAVEQNGDRYAVMIPTRFGGNTMRDVQRRA